MAEATFTRKLSAILLTCVVRYSFLTGEDDLATLHSLETFDIGNIDFQKGYFRMIAHVGTMFDIERRLL
jgi:hypothetical protein